MGIAKQHALFREALQVRRWYCLSVRLDIATRIVRVQIEDIRPTPGGLDCEKVGGDRAGGGKAFQCIPAIHAHHFIPVNEFEAFFVKSIVSSPSLGLLGLVWCWRVFPAAALELNGVVVSASDRKPLKRAELVLRSMDAAFPLLARLRRFGPIRVSRCCQIALCASGLPDRLCAL